tara:strand:+ start:208 stop:492 length:285 start_codon:yes stop_codon:yes gene_type:complete
MADRIGRAHRTRSVTDPLLPLTPEQRIRELEEKIALSNQKAQFFEAVVTVLKDDYGVSIVKKRPGKSSPRANRRPEQSQGLPVYGRFAPGALQA